MTARQFGDLPALEDLDTTPDDELALAVDDEPGTGLAALRAKLKAAAEADAPTIVVSNYPVPGMTSTHRLDFTSRDLDKWRKRSKDRSMSDGVYGPKFAGLVLGATCVGISHGGEPVTDPDTGRPLTYLDVDVRKAMSDDGATTLDVWQAVAAAYPRAEAALLAACALIVREAGWDEQADASDPTE